LFANRSKASTARSLARRLSVRFSTLWTATISSKRRRSLLTPSSTTSGSRSTSTCSRLAARSKTKKPQKKLLAKNIASLLSVAYASVWFCRKSAKRLALKFLKKNCSALFTIRFVAIRARKRKSTNSCARRRMPLPTFAPRSLKKRSLTICSPTST